MTERMKVCLSLGIALLLLLSALTLSGCTEAELEGTPSVGPVPGAKGAEAVSPPPAEIEGDGTPASSLPYGEDEDDAGIYDLLNQNGEEDFYDVANQSGEIPAIDSGYVEGNDGVHAYAEDDALVSGTYDILNQNGEGTTDLQHQNE